jgi:hypothetical protein
LTTVGKKRHTLLEVLGSSVDELQSNELESTLLETADDIADESPLDTVGLTRSKTISTIETDEGDEKSQSRTLTMM